MNTHPPAGRLPGSDPLLDPTIANTNVERSERRTHHNRPEAARRCGERPPHRQHAARGARAAALTASVVATGAIAAALAYSEGAWSASTEVAAHTSTTAAASTTPNTSATTSTTSEPTQPAVSSVESSTFVDGEFIGSAEYTEWGDVQVQVTISSGAIVGVEAVQYPTGRKSTDINSQAIPMLEANAVAIQNADLDIVSGATYTSHTYADSLQAALDQAALAVDQEAGTS